MKSFNLNHLMIGLGSIALLGSASCTNARQTVGTTFPSARNASLAPSTAATVVGTGERAVRIIFKNSEDAGSFRASSTAVGTQSAVRLFDTAGMPLATKDGADSTKWPQWLTSVELGLSGVASSSNYPTHRAGCARFATDPAEDAPPSYYRVSEYECVGSGAEDDAPGTLSDGIFIRATFNRNTAFLGTGENIMAVLEYSATSPLPTPENPTECFENGNFRPENCNVLLWNAYLKKFPTEATQPFLMLIPPALANPGAGGSNITTRQLILPLSANPELKVFQLNRIRALRSNRSVLEATCGTGTHASPLKCAGVVFLSMTLYRI